MSDEERTTQSEEGGETQGDPGTSNEEVRLTKEDIGKIIDERVSAAERHFQGVAQRQVNTFRAETEEAKRRAANAETQLAALQEQQFNNMDSDGKIAYLTNQVHQMRTGQVQPNMPVEPQMTYKDIMSEQLRAQGIDPEDPRIDWATDELDAAAGAQRLGKSVAKIRAEDLDKAVQSKVDAIEAAARKKVEEEYEVGGEAAVETGGVRSGTRGKKFTRKQIADMPPDEYEKNLKEGNLG